MQVPTGVRRAAAHHSTDETTHVFDQAADHIKAHLERELFPRFMAADEYVQMMVDRMRVEDYDAERYECAGLRGGRWR